MVEWKSLDDYMEYVEEQESPREFHIWSALTAAACMAARRVWLNRGYYNLYPNVYIIVVSGSALCRKSTAIDLTISLLYDAFNSLRSMGLGAGMPAILAGKISPEALFRKVSEEGIETLHNTEGEQTTDGHISRPLLIHSSELGTILSKAAQVNGIVDIITDIYTCPAEREYVTKGQGIDKVYNAWVSILGATTPSWVSENMTSNVFNQGFLGRCLIVYSDTPYKLVAEPIITPKMEQAKTRLIHRLTQIGLLQGEMSRTPKAIEMYDAWYNTRPNDIKATDAETGFFGREHDHVLKVSMLLSLLRSNSLVIDHHDIKKAIAMIATVKQHKEQLFYNVPFAGEDPTRKLVEGFLRESADWVKRSVLLSGLYRKVSREALDGAIDTLDTAKQIETKVERVGARGPMTTFYRWCGKSTG